MATIDWTEEFGELTGFEDNQWNNATLEERQNTMEELVNTIDIDDQYKGYVFQTADLPDGDFVEIDAETQTITFDRKVLETAELKDCILNDLFAELNTDSQISGCFAKLYCSHEHINYSADTSQQCSAIDTSQQCSAIDTSQQCSAIDTSQQTHFAQPSFGGWGYACGASCRLDGGTSTGGPQFWTLRAS